MKLPLMIILALLLMACTKLVLADEPAVAEPASTATAVDEKAASEPVAVLTPAYALKALQDGNARYVAEQNKADLGDRRRQLLVHGQHPLATVLSCADSRVVPELIFDQGIGNLFSVAVAGNITGPAVTGSLEYGVEHLNTPLLVILGHEDCGAVRAAMLGKQFSGDLGWLVSQVHIGRLNSEDPELAMDFAAAANARFQAQSLISGSAHLSSKVRDGSLMVVVGVYSLHTSRVNWIYSSAEDFSVAIPQQASR